MRVIHWDALDSSQRAAALTRPRLAARTDVLKQARDIIEQVRSGGAAAIRALTLRFDSADVAELRVSDDEFAAARNMLALDDVLAIERAANNVRTFHAAQSLPPLSIETEPGMRCERLLRPIPAIGLYVPAGSAPLPSTVVMLAVPAALAGCPTRILCTPPQRDGSANAAVLAAAQICGVSEVYKVGGAQAIAAMAYGLAGLPKVDKILGPGNAWVTAAKQLVAADPHGAALDMPAGPSEVLVIADDSAHPEFVAADLLAQAEHDPLAQALLLTSSAALADAVLQQVMRQQPLLSRRAVLERSLAASRIVVVASVAEAVELSNLYAPEHLILQVRDARHWLSAVSNAGSIFLGNWTPEPLGDYCSGTNHVLPTYGHARAYSGLSLLDFSKRVTVQEATPPALLALGPVAVRLAELEGLDAHAAAVKLRLAALAEAAR